jgi:hypothetical protein
VIDRRVVRLAYRQVAGASTRMRKAHSHSHSLDSRTLSNSLSLLLLLLTRRHKKKPTGIEHGHGFSTDVWKADAKLCEETKHRLDQQEASDTREARLPDRYTPSRSGGSLAYGSFGSFGSPPKSPAFAAKSSVYRWEVQWVYTNGQQWNTPQQFP